MPSPRAWVNANESAVHNRSSVTFTSIWQLARRFWGEKAVGFDLLELSVEGFAMLPDGTVGAKYLSEEFFDGV
ncbi:MAG: hypothetical protein N2A42_10060, partial [Luteolibacter sp.]